MAARAERVSHMNRGRHFAVVVGVVVATLGAAHADQTAQNLAAKGEYLVRVGGCAACHTAPGGQPFAGGVAINSPFGTLYGPNITPDKTYGIGDWSDDDFYRTLHEGIAKGGVHLYPAFPYQWFTKVTREDVRAIKAWLDTLAPVATPSPKTALMFPFNVRAGLAAWNAAYFHEGECQPDPARSEEINRGAYLVEGLGHCGACHTPRGVGQEPIASKAYSGGAVDNWYAPNISSDVTRGIGGWSEDAMVQYLKTGSAPGKGVVAGPMAEVVHESLSHLTDADVHAIAAYLKATPPVADYAAKQPVPGTGPQLIGAGPYLNHCASCHQQDGRGLPGAIPPLADNGAVTAKGPENVIRVILAGHMALGSYAPMPAVGVDMANRDVADVTNYVRTMWSNGAPATANEDLVAAIRTKTFSMLQGQAAPDGRGDPCRSAETLDVAPIADGSGEVDRILAGAQEGSLPQAADRAVARVQQVMPKASQADIINGLTVGYCKVASQAEQLRDARSRLLLNRFSQLVYTSLVSTGPASATGN